MSIYMMKRVDLQFESGPRVGEEGLRKKRLGL